MISDKYVSVQLKLSAWICCPPILDYFEKRSFFCAVFVWEYVGIMTSTSPASRERTSSCSTAMRETVACVQDSDPQFIHFENSSWHTHSSQGALTCWFWSFQPHYMVFIVSGDMELQMFKLNIILCTLSTQKIRLLKVIKMFVHVWMKSVFCLFMYE